MRITDDLTLNCVARLGNGSAWWGRLQFNGTQALNGTGEVIFEDGEPTGALPGKLVRGPQAAPGV